MTTRELQSYLQEHLVPSRLYDLKKAHNKRLCMEQVRDGWNVYYADKKDKVGISHYLTESDACLAMRNEINKVMRVMYGVTFA